MENLRYYAVMDEKPSTTIIRKQIEAQLAQNMMFTDNIDEANAILVGGGDGYMLDMIKKYCDLNKIFVGMNYGSLGFLLNGIKNIEELPKTMEELDIIEEVTPKVIITTQDGEEHLTHAINDIVIGKHVLDYFHFNVNYGNEQISTKGSGFIVSTAIGSSGYRLGNGGMLLPLNSKIRGIMGLATKPFSYDRFKTCRIHITTHGKQLPDIGVDGYGPGFHQNVTDVIIEPDGTSVRIGFTKQEEFVEKRLILAKQKLSS